MAAPVPPEGISAGALYSAAVNVMGEERALAWWRWLTVEYPLYSGEGWTRLNSLRFLCDTG